MSFVVGFGPTGSVTAGCSARQIGRRCGCRRSHVDGAVDYRVNTTFSAPDCCGWKKTS